MKLYHGTSSRYLDDILKNGIRPREQTGNSNWKGSVISKKGFVYLTTAYPVYFAFSAVDKDADLLVIETEVDEKNLYPDEDYIAMCLHKHDEKFKHMDLKDVNKFVNPEEYKEYWEASYKHNGNVCHKGIIKSSQIVRHVIIPRDEFGVIMSIGGDSMPIPINYMIQGELYRNYMKVLFNKGLDGIKKALQKQQKKYEKMFKEAQLNRI